MKNRLLLGSMRGRLTLGFALCVALFLGLLCAVMVAYSRQLEATQLARTLENHAQQYERILENNRDLPRTTRGWQAFLERENRTLRDIPLSMLVLDSSQNVVARAHGNGPRWPLGGDWLVETVQTPTHTLVLTARWHSSEREIRDFMLKLALLASAVICGTALGTWLLVGQVLSPIGRLSQQARAASIEDLRVSLQAPSRDVEVVGLVSTLNVLLERIARAAQSRSRFYAAASHELRTPIQGLSALLEVGLSRPRTGEQWHEIAREALGESQRLQSLTQDLLTLNQLENQSVASPRVLVDAADLLSRVLVACEAEAREKRLQITLDMPEDAEICAPWNHLHILFRNLVENAVKYAPREAGVRILLHLEEKNWSFSVWNHAELGADFDAEKLFEPFYRPDEARHSQTGGNGLGLSLVASVCRANGWSVSLQHQNCGFLALVGGERCLNEISVGSQVFPK